MNKPKSKIENIVVQELNKELLIYDLQDNKAFCLNETSAIIYQLCDGKRTVADINEALSKQLNQSVNDELIWLALDGLKKEGLLEDNEVELDFNGLNRRQIIRKVGLASLIALPLISSIVAPSAVMAQSGGIALLGACPSGSGCASGLTCRNCSRGSCGGTLTCCSNFGFQGPNHVLTVCVSSNACPGFSSSCCSGSAIPRPTATPGFCPGQFDCVCA